MPRRFASSGLVRRFWCDTAVLTQERMFLWVCGRYACSLSAETIAGLFEAENLASGVAPSWNVSPGHDALVVRRHPRDGRQLHALEWAKTTRVRRGQALSHDVPIEDIDDSDFLTELARTQRCLVPLEAFYVWHGLPSGSWPFAVGRRHGRTMAIAGLWTFTPVAGGERKRTFAVLTTQAAGVVGVLKDQMPVIVDEADWPLWLGEIDGDARAVLKRQTGEGLHAWQVRKAVNHQLNDGWELLHVMYDVNAGDPFISFEFASLVVAELRGRLGSMLTRYRTAMAGHAPAQANVAFESTAEAFSGCLDRAEPLCGWLGIQKKPRHPLDPDPVETVFGRRHELSQIGARLAELLQIVRAWAHCTAEGLPWPAPDTFRTLLWTNTAFRGSSEVGWPGGPMQIRHFPYRLQTDHMLVGPHDLIQAAEALVSLADSVMTVLDATGDRAPGELRVA